MAQIHVDAIRRRVGALNLVSNGQKQKNDTYGTICFEDSGSEASKNAPFIRLNVPVRAEGKQIDKDEEDQRIRKQIRRDVANLWKLMKSGWKVPPPKLIISVTGGCQSFYLSQRSRNGFEKALISLASTADAWIVTSGTKSGVMQMVGEAACYHKERKKLAERDLVLLGVVNWNAIANNECLRSTEQGKFPCSYVEKPSPMNQQAATTEGGSKKSSSGHSFLDPHHTHFVLIDDGRPDRYGSELEFRAHLEREIGRLVTVDGVNLPIPTVLLVLEGGIGSLQTVCGTIKMKTPVVVIAGSGRAANLIAYALNNKNRWNMADETYIRQTAALMRVQLDPGIEKLIRTEEKNQLNYVFRCADYVDELLKLDYENLLTVIELKDEDVQYDIEKAVFNAIITAQRNVSHDENPVSQLELALAWNRADIAKTTILNAKKSKLEDEHLYLLLQKALLDDKDQFVQTLVDIGIDLSKFLTVEQLKDLYLVVDKTDVCEKLLRCIKNAKERCKCSIDDSCTICREDFKLECVAELIKDFTDGCCCLNVSKEDTTKFDRPERELFYWALLLKRKNLAVTFWKLGKDNVGGALVASILCITLEKIAHQEDEPDLAEQFNADASEYQALATGILNECYSVDKKKSRTLVTRNFKMWGDRTLLALADGHELMDFMQTSCCQTLLNQIWQNGMVSSTPLWKILFSLIVPFGLFTITYTDQDGECFEDDCSHLAVERVNNIELSKFSSTSVDDNDINGNRKRESGGTNYKIQQRRSLLGKGFHAITCYYTAPIVDFYYTMMSYLVFLGLFSFFVLTDLVPHYPSVYEYIVWAWALTMFIEKARQCSIMEAHTFKKKLVAYFRSNWHRLDLVMYVLFVISIALRYSLPASTFVWARMFYVSTLSVYYLRFMRFFYVEKNIGTKVLAIQRMLHDLIFFLLLLIVFLFAFGVGSQALLYPNSPTSWSLLYDVVTVPYFNMLGYFDRDAYIGVAEGCSSNASVYENDPSIPRCPAANALAYFMLAIYMLLVYILLINLLVAMFGTTFTDVHENSLKVWKFFRYELVKEYYEKPSLPPPMIVVCHTWMLLRFLYQKFKPLPPGCHNTAFKKHFREEENKRLEAFERDSMELYFIKKRRSENNSTVEAQQFTIQQDQLSRKIHLIEKQVQTDESGGNQSGLPHATVGDQTIKVLHSEGAQGGDSYGNESLISKKEKSTSWIRRANTTTV